MGIKGLAKLLSDEAPDSIREVPLSSLHGRKIAGMASVWAPDYAPVYLSKSEIDHVFNPPSSL